MPARMALTALVMVLAAGDSVTLPLLAQETILSQRGVYNGYSGDEKILLTRFHEIWIDSVDSGKTLGTLTARDQLRSAFTSELKSDAAKFGQSLPREFSISSDASNRLFFTNPPDWASTRNTIENVLGGPKGALGTDHVLFVYIACHGGAAATNDAANPADDQRLQIGKDNVRRGEVRAVFQKLQKEKQARLLVFITDACNPKSATTAIAGKTDPKGGQIWRSLYFGHTGLADIASAQSGALADFDGAGPVFLQAYAESFDNGPTGAWPKETTYGVGFISWDDYFQVLQSRIVPDRYEDRTKAPQPVFYSRPKPRLPRL
jgi:hypothetical protein